MKARKIKKLLVANRGEIALRVIRSARVMGIRTVAVYSEADKRAEHATAADEACLIGPAEPALSYLNAEAILAAAKATHADAIHPGYGFLSERPEFARAVEGNGIVFVGPPAPVMAALGDKVSARKLAQKTSVPVVPGIETGDLSSARRFADAAGFPVMVKAAAGGGGRGMRLVEDSSGLAAALESASREAASAFGDGRVFLEKYLARPRHVEIQILGDNHGKVVALGERECSIQRRHQKIIEESPSPGLSERMQTAMVEAALRLAQAAGYRNAGTAEFLVDGDSFYFLEVNARLQVEHPITEIRYGCDLVCEQIEIAAGGHASDPASPRGWAIECRVNAEDAEHDFRPATGTIVHLNLPSGPGVRVDTHLSAGAVIPPYYDSLLAKVICHGEDREQVRRRMIGALTEWSMAGVQNTAAFLRDVVASKPFAKADLSTRFIPEFFARWRPGDDVIREALIAAAMVADGTLGSPRNGSAGVKDGATSRESHDARSPWSRLSGFALWSRQ